MLQPMHAFAMPVHGLQLPLADGCASLVTAAQAAHWFDLPAFYAQARRVAAPGGILALLSYGVLHLPQPALQARFQQFYVKEIGPYWPAERKLVDSGYASLSFPLQEIVAPALSIAHDWNLPEFLGYLSTWSAVRRAQEAGCDALLWRFADDLSALWGAPTQRHTVIWPLHMRVGRWD